MKIITCFKLVPEEQDIVVTPEYTLNFDNADAKISQFDLNAIEAASQLATDDDEIAALEFDIPKRGRSVDAVELAARVSEVRPRARIELLGAGGIFVSRPRPRLICLFN